MADKNELMPDLIFGGEWLQQFETQVLGCALQQMVAPNEAPRLLAMALGLVILLQRLVSPDCPPNGLASIRTSTWHELLLSRAGNAPRNTPTAAELVVILDMASTAYSLLDHRRLTVGLASLNLPVETLFEGLSPLIVRTVARLDAEAAAATAPLFSGAPAVHVA